MRSLPAMMYADDLDEMPDDGNRYEVIEGGLIVSPAPTPNHQRSSRSVFRKLDRRAATSGLGEVFYAPIDVRLSPDTQVQPDIVYVSNERAAIITRKRIEGAPDLIMEIISPSSVGIDTIRKAAAYARAGVREYWLLNPDRRTIEAFALIDGRFEPLTPDADGRIHSLVLADFVMGPDDVFGELK